MLRVIFDIETDSIEAPTKLWSVVVRGADTGAVLHSTHSESGSPRDHEASLHTLMVADRIVGHNVIGYDLPVLRDLAGLRVPEDRVEDTLVLTRVLWPDLRNSDYRIDGFPKDLVGSHSLKAWGRRIGVLKGDFNHDETDWSAWTPEMQSYCEQDTLVNLELYRHIRKFSLDRRCEELEHKVAFACRRIEEAGFGFDEEGARRLAEKLQVRRAQLHEELVRVFPPRRIQLKTKVKEIPFNPGSREDIVRGLQELRGWKPKEMTSTRSLKDGRTKVVYKVDEEILGSLGWPESTLLLEYLMTVKRLGQVAEGQEAWRKLSRSGRIHGRINPNGAFTGRATHSNPNISAVPRGTKPYAHECRSLFIPKSGYGLVGCDAKGLELRCLAHFMAAWDGGRYSKIVVESDPHWENAKAFNLVRADQQRDESNRDLEAKRDQAKTGIYALIYGAFDAKLGSIQGKGPVAGRKMRRAFEIKNPAYKRLVDAIESKISSRQCLRGLDGRPLPIRETRTALNTVLQSAGAVVMKHALVRLDEVLRRDYAGRARIVGWIHDEFQIECEQGLEGACGEAAVESIRSATEAFRFRCPLDGQWKGGSSWAETH